MLKSAILLLTGMAILVADQVTKALVVAHVTLGERVQVLGDLVQVVHAQNRGAAFSLFQGGSIFFLAVSILSMGMVAYFHRSLRARPWWVHLVIGLVLGGTLGNFIDRLRLGYVTDWLSVGIGDLRWPTFNVADSSIVVGIGTLVLYLLVTNPDRQEARA
ncbi:MAG: signal peptidase II [Chloroflexota bacterium]|nr:signal peptidase II [Chloroflexota bacterium]